MANNRMFLCYKPSGRAIMLGKHMCQGWYSAPSKEETEKFFDECYNDMIEHNSTLEDFVLITEYDNNWQYRENWTEGNKFIDFKKSISIHELANEIVKIFHDKFCTPLNCHESEFKEPLSLKHVEMLKLAYSIIEMIKENI